MKITDVLAGVRRLFLDTAPVVYYVEGNDRYAAILTPVFDAIDAGTLDTVVSPVTLAECLVVPIRQKEEEIRQAFTDLLLLSGSVTFISLDERAALQAADLRARYNLTLPDAFQVGAALAAGCDAFLTNDAFLKRVTELNIYVLQEIEASEAS